MTYFLEATVSDSDSRESLKNTESIKAYVFIKSEELDSALRQANFLIKKDGWEIIKWIKTIRVTRDMFLDREEGLKHFDLAQVETSSILYLGVDNSLIRGESRELEIAYGFDKKEYYSKDKSIAMKKMCLHFDAGLDCNEIIKAHSIQNMNALSAIARDGHVYQLDMNKLSKKNTIGYKLVGINKASIFNGFCKKHDNSLFEPIDNHNLKPTKQQAFLYAYRSISKELFTKRQAIDRAQTMLDSSNGSEFVSANLKGMVNVLLHGTKQLEVNKTFYDESIKNCIFDDIRYVSFLFDDRPIVAFSGLIYPDYDFQGRAIQSLISDSTLGLMTFCSAPTDEGWAFIFSWHKSSDPECYVFMNSLQEVIKSGKRLEDYLFQLIILNCENHAFSPVWWENLTHNKQSFVCNLMEKQVDIFSEIKSDYLANPPQGFITWKLDGVHDSRI